jgi:hypothetical protein
MKDHTPRDGYLQELQAQLEDGDTRTSFSEDHPLHRQFVGDVSR